MARYVEPISAWLWPGVGAAGFLVALTVGSIAVVFLYAGTGTSLGSADWAAIRFTLLQAVLSAVISVALAIPVARALARRRFPGRGVLISLLGAPFILPVIVAVLGLITLLGQDGLLARTAGALGLEMPRIYGLHGVVLAHAFFNLPLAARFILQGWSSIPAEHFRLAACLSLTARRAFWLIEWPMLRAVLPGAVLVIFLICLTSFAVALTLGGGPRATTIELAIYQAFRFDFDLSKAAGLALVQVVMTVAAAVLAYRVAIPMAFGAGLGRPVRRWEAETVPARALDAGVILLVSLFLFGPITMVLLRGTPELTGVPVSVWASAGRSLAVALGSAALTLSLAGALALSIVLARRRYPTMSGTLESIGYLSVAASPLVIGTALFIVIFPIADPARAALVVTAVVNAAMSLPFALRVLIPAIETARAAHRRLAESLGMPALARVRYAYGPVLRAPVGFAAGLSAALSMGDLGVIALFADPERPTLPLQIYRLMAAYRMDDAMGAAVLLVALSMGLFWILDRGGRRHA